MKKTRTILIKENSKRKIELTINPKNLTIKDSVANTRKNVDRKGEVNLPGHRGLKEVTINTFLPGNLKLIDRWKKNNTKLRVVISNPKMNFLALLDSESTTLVEGRNDVLIDWSLSEYKKINVPTVEAVSGLFVTEPALSERSEENAPAAGGSETVKKGTTLWALAVKYYGDGTKWTKISQANGGVDPKKLKIGTVLTIPS